MPAREAEGAILAHGLRTAAGAFKKGRVLAAADIDALLAAGQETVVAARLEAGDIGEDAAAAAVAAAARGAGVAAAAPFAGRSNLYAEAAGLALVDPARVDAVNRLDESLTLATAAPFAPVARRRMMATVKVIPFAAPASAVAAAARLAAEGGPLISLAPFGSKTIGLVMSRLPGARATVLDNTARTVRERAARVGARLLDDRRVDHEESAIAGAVSAFVASGADIVLVSGASAVVDRRDVAPAGIERAGGRIEHFGMPVDPGNLLLLAAVENAGRRVPVVVMPGCARSPKLNGFDWVLERLAADLPVRGDDIRRMGAGGLLKEIPVRPQPRDRAAPGAADTSTASARMPRVAALLLAAGQSLRMGEVNKLLADIDGAPMVRRVAETLAASKTSGPPVVVTGHEAARVREALAGLDATFAHNPDYADGLSASLRRGLAVLTDSGQGEEGDYDGVLVCLADMPDVTAADIDRLVAAFDPEDGRAIVVPTNRGKRGNPVLWGARFFPRIAALSGDVGGRRLIGENAEWVCEVPVGGDGVLRDIDTAETLADRRRGSGGDRT